MRVYFTFVIPLLLLAFVLMALNMGFDNRKNIRECCVLAFVFAGIFIWQYYKCLQSISINKNEIRLSYQVWNKVKQQMIPITPATNLEIIAEARAKYESKKVKLAIFQGDKVIFSQSEGFGWTKEKFEEVRAAFKERQ